MLQKIQIGSVNKIVQKFDIELISTLMIEQSSMYDSKVRYYKCINQNNKNSYQMYMAQEINFDLDQILPIETSPKLLILRQQKEYNIIIEQQTRQSLQSYIQYIQKDTSKPYIYEDMHRVIDGVTESLKNYQKNKINYMSIHPNNIVSLNQNWTLSLVALILQNHQSNSAFYNPNLEGEYAQVYALGSLLFFLTFGFQPYESVKKPEFKFSKYLQHLCHQKQKRLLKVYNYVQGMYNMNQQQQNIIEQALSGKMRFEQWIKHPFHSSKYARSDQLDQKILEIKMIGSQGQKFQSLILAAIDQRNKFPQNKLNSTDQINYQQISDPFSKNIILQYLKYSQKYEQSQSQQIFDNYIALATDNRPYFYKHKFSFQNSYPCNDLLQLLKQQGFHDPLNNHEGCELKLYAYPYAMAFELAKVSPKEQVHIQKQISHAIELLLQLSSMFQSKRIKPLHTIQTEFKTFEEIKIRYRKIINELYQHFLAKAMKLYNKSTQNTELKKSKGEGLEYYRLCLKLLEASLLVRKEGKNLDLMRIETNQRKQIESDLQKLLKYYFPTKVKL